MRDGRPAPPVHVQLILSDLCNHSCGFCAYREPGYTSSQRFWQINERLAGGLRRDPAHPERDYNPNRQIAWPKVLEILDDCQEMGVGALQLTGGGEPTVHPQWLQTIVEANRRSLDVALVTNGVLLQRPADAELAALCEWIRISLDAGDAQTYAETRGCPESHFATALDSVGFIRRSRERLGTATLIGVGFVVTPFNWAGIFEAARLAREAGADNIRISAQFSAENELPFLGFHNKAAELARRAEELSGPDFSVYNRFSDKLADLRLGAPDYDRCGFQFFTTYIGADLCVYRCCVLAYNDRGLVGSIANRRFSELWMTQRRAEEMAVFDARGCERCQFNGINRTLDYVLAHEEPKHSNFV